MLLNRRLTGTEPVIVAGMPRAGTRFVATMLNRHPRIHLLGELHPPAFRQVTDLMRSLDDEYAQLPDHWQQRGAGWRTHQRDLLYAAWAANSKTTTEGRLPRRLRWFGHKTPNHDQHWQFYRELGIDVRWVFCVRNFAANYLSLDAMRPRPIEKAAQSYKNSVDRYLKMRAELADRVSLFVLDDLAEGGTGYLRSVLFEQLDIPATRTVTSRLSASERINSSAAAQRPVRELTAAEREFIEGDPALTGSLDTVRQATASRSRSR